MADMDMDMDMEFLKMQLADTFESMKQEGLVNDTFGVVYSLKQNARDKFFIELIPKFCSDAQDVLNILAQLVADDVLNYNLMKEYVFKVKGGSLSLGACRFSNALTNLERAIDAASKKECVKAVSQAQHEYSAVAAKLNSCLQVDRRIVFLAIHGNPRDSTY